MTRFDYLEAEGRDGELLRQIADELWTFVREISEDEWYSHGADRTDVQKEAALLLADLGERLP